MGKMLIIKNADFSQNAIDTQPVPPGPTPSGEWVVGYKALYEKYLALSGLSEQEFINTYCSGAALNPFYFIDKNMLMSGKTVTKFYIIGHGGVSPSCEYGICDGWDSSTSRNILGPVKVGTFIISAGQPAGETTLEVECQVPSDKYFYWRIISGGGDIFKILDATKLSAFNPTDLENFDRIEYVVPGFPRDLILSQLDFFIK